MLGGKSWRPGRKTSASCRCRVSPENDPFRLWPRFREAFFTNETLRPLARFLCTSNTAEGYVQGLRQLRTYHARLPRRRVRRLSPPRLARSTPPGSSISLVRPGELGLSKPRGRWLERRHALAAPAAPLQGGSCAPALRRRCFHWAGRLPFSVGELSKWVCD